MSCHLPRPELTVLTFIAGLASVIYIPLAGWLVQRQGWRGALCTLAAVLAVGTIPLHAVALRRRPEDLGLTPDGAPASTPDQAVETAAAHGVPLGVALRDTTFWWLSTALEKRTNLRSAGPTRHNSRGSDFGFMPSYWRL